MAKIPSSSCLNFVTFRGAPLLAMDSSKALNLPLLSSDSSAKKRSKGDRSPSTIVCMESSIPRVTVRVVTLKQLTPKLTSVNSFLGTHGGLHDRFMADQEFTIAVQRQNVMPIRGRWRKICWSCTSRALHSVDSPWLGGTSRSHLPAGPARPSSVPPARRE